MSPSFTLPDQKRYNSDVVRPSALQHRKIYCELPDQGLKPQFTSEDTSALISVKSGTKKALESNKEVSATPTWHKPTHTWCRRSSSMTRSALVCAVGNIPSDLSKVTTITPQQQQGSVCLQCFWWGGLK